MTFTRSYAGFLVATCLLTGCATLDSGPKKSTPTGLISTPVSYYSTAKAKYLGTKYKENLDRLVEQIVRNPKTAPLQFANNISSVGGIGFFTHSAAKSPDERFLEVVLATPETFETKGEYSEKIQRLFSRYGFDLLGILNSDNEMYQDRELSGYGLNLAWRNIVTEPAGSRVVLARAIIYLPKDKVRSYLRNDIKQAALLADAVIFGEEEDAPLALVSIKPQEIRPDFRPAIREDNLVAAEESKPSQSVSASAPSIQANEEKLEIAKAAVPDHLQSRPSGNEPTPSEGEIENTLTTGQAEQQAGTSLGAADSGQTAKPLSPAVIEQAKALPESSSLDVSLTGTSRLTPVESKTSSPAVKPEGEPEKQSTSKAPESVAAFKPATEPALEKVESPPVKSSNEARKSETEKQATAGAAKPVLSAPIVQSEPPKPAQMMGQKTTGTVIAPLPTTSSLAAPSQETVTKKLTEELPHSNQGESVKKTQAPVTTIEPPISQKNPTALPEKTGIDQKISSVLQRELALGENGNLQIGKKRSEPESVGQASPPASTTRLALAEEKKKSPLSTAAASDANAGGLKYSKPPVASSGSPQIIKDKFSSEQIELKKTDERTAETKATAQSSTKMLQESRLNQFSVPSAAVSTNVEQGKRSSEQATPVNKVADQPINVPSTQVAQSAEQYKHSDLKSSAATPLAGAEKPHEKTAPEQIALLKKPAQPILEQKPLVRPAAKVLEGYIIQIAFNDKEKAQHWAEAMERRGYAVSVTEAGSQGALRVRLGNFAVRDEAERQLRTFKQDGMNGIIINLPQGFRPQARSSVP